MFVLYTKNNACNRLMISKLLEKLPYLLQVLIMKRHYPRFIYIDYNLTYKVLILLLLHLDDLRRTVFNEHILYLFIDSTSSFV